MYKLLPGICFIVSFFCCSYCFGQAVPGDSTGQTMAATHAAGLFNAAIGQQSRLYNGPEYYLYDPIIKGNAYFQDIFEFKPGAVVYDGIAYSNVPMMYDLNKDIVAVLLYNNFSRFALLNQRVQSFDLFNHHFVYITTDSLNTSSAVSTGFYDEVYGGNLQALVKWSKSVQQSSTATTIETYFTSTKSYYLKKGNTYYSISGQSSLLKVLKDKKKELQQYIKANKIKYKDDPDKAIALIAARYDQL
ncbi:MAG: hypothetical protein JWQ66_397 [Mucilaginibacter sp.]|nr:hypothetical protein [Mucilaginibacter sp.]